MIYFQGAKANMKRERNAKAGKADPKSQKKTVRWKQHQADIYPLCSTWR